MSLQGLLSGFQSCSTNSSQVVFELFENTLLTLIQESSLARAIRFAGGQTAGRYPLGSRIENGGRRPTRGVMMRLKPSNTSIRCLTALSSTTTRRPMNYRATTSSETDLNTALTKIGTGKGPLNGGLEALAKGPVALHSELDEAPTTDYAHPPWAVLDEPHRPVDGCTGSCCNRSAWIGV